ncbi:hypothetical protein L3Q82_011594, partial [Scortum barcoo]
MRIQAAEMSFLRRVAGRSHLEIGEVFQACPTGRRPPGKTQDTHAGETMSLGWPGNASEVPPEELEEVSG